MNYKRELANIVKSYVRNYSHGNKFTKQISIVKNYFRKCFNARIFHTGIRPLCFCCTKYRAQGNYLVNMNHP